MKLTLVACYHGDPMHQTGSPKFLAVAADLRENNKNHRSTNLIVLSSPRILFTTSDAFLFETGTRRKKKILKSCKNVRPSAILYHKTSEIHTKQMSLNINDADETISAIYANQPGQAGY